MTKSILSFLKTQHLYLGLIRYALGIFMLLYSLTKILKIQFALPSFVWVQPLTLESISSTQLAWAFLGNSGWFQILLGFLELIPALLLFFRKTTLLGAILMLPITLNIVLINFALNLWDGTKILSTLLLILNVLVFVFTWDRIKMIFSTIIGDNFKLKFNPFEISANVIIIGLASCFPLKSLMEIRSQSNDLTGDWLNKNPIEWTLEREECKDSVLAPRDVKLYFWAYGQCKEVGDIEEESPISYNINIDKKELNLKFNNGDSIKCNYSFPDDDRLKIEMVKNQSTITRYYRKRIININKY